MNKEPETTAAGTPEKKAKTAAGPESVYSVDELAKAAVSLFGATPDLVRTALRMAGLTEATVSAAKSRVEKFKKREVR